MHSSTEEVAKTSSIKVMKGKINTKYLTSREMLPIPFLIFLCTELFYRHFIADATAISEESVKESE